MTEELVSPATNPETTEVPEVTLEEVLVYLAESDIERFQILFKRTREGSNEEVTRACVRHIAEHGTDDAGQKMLFWLIANTAYLEVLLDSEFLPLEEAKRVAIIMRDADPRFFARFNQHDNQSDTDASLARLNRALRLFAELGNCSVLLPWLRTLTYHSNEHIRSKAVKALCELRPNAAMVERQLKSEDPRVRANAVEALWAVKNVEAVEVFREALNDSSHRVVVNAVVGLCRMKAKGSFEKLSALTDDASALVRSAAAWALGEVADPRGVPLLHKLASDRSKAVRHRATLSLALFAAPEENREAKVEIAAEQIPVVERPRTHERPLPAERVVETDILKIL